MLFYQHLCFLGNGFLNRRSQVRVLPGVLEEVTKTTDDSKSQGTSKSAKNQEVTSTPTGGSTPSKNPAEGEVWGEVWGGKSGVRVPGINQ